MSGQLHALATLPPGNEPPIHIQQETKWLYICSGHGGKDRIPTPAGSWTPDVQPVASRFIDQGSLVRFEGKWVS
jgi:hypothetical protein